jgi:hypothetical protein
MTTFYTSPEKVMKSAYQAFVAGAIIAATAIAPAWAQDVSASSVQVRVSDGSFHPDHQQAISYEDQDVVLKLLQESGKSSVQIDWTGRPRREVTVPDEIAQVDSIQRVVNERALLLGHVNASVSAVMVLDLKSGSVSDYFMASDPAMSPDSHFLAFVRFYPPHSVDGVEDQYRLYDLSKTASENRPLLTGKASDDTDNVGQPVYPADTGEASRENTGVAEDQAHRLTSQGFFWASNSRRFIFADEHSGRVALVMVGVEGSGRVTAKAADISRLCPASGCEYLSVDKVIYTAAGITIRAKSLHPGEPDKSAHIEFSKLAAVK